MTDQMTAFYRINVLKWAYVVSLALNLDLVVVGVEERSVTAARCA